MARVYRVQNKNGRGPYSARFTIDDEILSVMFHRHNYTSEYHRGPAREFGRIPFRDEEACGFSSKRQLHRWFTPRQLKALAANGFNVYKIDAKITAKGERQILFSVKSKTSETVA